MKIKKWLIAGRHNNYHPHLLRPLGLSVVVFLLLLTNIGYNLTAAHKFQVLGAATSINSSDIISLTNQQRAANGLGSLAYNAALTRAAADQAAYMFEKDYWAHYAPDGTSPWSFITREGYAYYMAGQNLAKGFDTSSDVVTAWMNSPEHRDNILNGKYVDTGVAVEQGTLQGYYTTLVVAFYATPQAAPAPKVAAPAQPKASTPVGAKPAAPASTPQAAPAPQPAAQPAAAPATTKPVPAVEISPQDKAQAAKIKRQIDDIKPVSVRYQRTWAQNVTLFILSMLLLVTVLRHTIVWRVKRRGWRHIWLRAHPAAQYGLLIVAIVANLASAAGVVL